MLRRLREATFRSFRRLREARTFNYPPNNELVVRVPKEGSKCGNCKYLGGDGTTCKNKDYIAFMGTNKLPLPKDRMCSIWWEERKVSK